MHPRDVLGELSLVLSGDVVCEKSPHIFLGHLEKLSLLPLRGEEGVGNG